MYMYICVRMFSTASSNTISVPSLLSYFHSINATQSALFNCLTYTETATQAVFHLTYVETVAEVVEHSNGQIDHLVTDDRVGQGQGHEERLKALISVGADTPSHDDRCVQKPLPTHDVTVCGSVVITRSSPEALSR